MVSPHNRVSPGDVAVIEARVIHVRYGIITTAVLLIGAATACSGGWTSGRSRAMELVPGSARVIVHGKDAGTSDAVLCSRVNALTTIQTGDDRSGTTVVVSNADKLTVKSVYFRSMDGFTGAYNFNLAGEATAALVGATYDITGAAVGYDVGSFRRTTERFTIRVAC
jgi:ipoprotein LpqH